MKVECPGCRAEWDLSASTPGRYKPRCASCGERLDFTVSPAEAMPNAKAQQAAGTSVHMVDLQKTEHVLTHFNPPTLADTQFPAPRKARKPAAASIPPEVQTGPAAPPERVPGFVIESTLGYGGMGTVYLARQLSLDRPVALKVMSRNWSSDAVFTARFTREAFAAAMLNHPNVVQIYDIGDVDGYRFFSMEYVTGKPLSDVVRLHGKLDPETAVGYILQAARGLKHAHERGLIHRDVKPDNLLLNDQGIIKVADLGLVKTPANLDDSLPENQHDTSDESVPKRSMTGVRIALGTPAYMAPEQCRDAATVDHRADIYSLGCTLYVLVTGRAPFDGRTAVELMTKHAYEQLIPPEQIVNRVPKELSTIIQKMMAKAVQDRYTHMADVIRALEQWLGIQHTGTFSPTDDQIDQLESCIHQFNHAPTAVLRSRVLTAAGSLVLLAAILFMFFGKLSWAFGLASLVAQSCFAYFMVNGLAKKRYFFRRVRQFVFSFSTWDVVLACGGFGLFALLLWMSGIFWLWVGFGLIGIALAGGVRLAFDRAIEKEREEPVQACGKMLRRMRQHGLDEEELRQFTAKYSGKHWEEFFEALFGFEAKLEARALLYRGNRTGPRDFYGAWREPILYVIDRIENARKETRERHLLADVERARLVAAGVDSSTARHAAVETADAFMDDVEAARGGLPMRGMDLNVAEFLAVHGRKQRFGLSAQPGTQDWLGVLLWVVVGPVMRVCLAMVLLAASVLWLHQNRAAFGFGTDENVVSGTVPLVIEDVPIELTSWVDSANTSWAGALLLASLFFRGNRMAMLVLLGAGICAFGHHFGIRTVEPIRDYHAAIILGSVFTLVGFRFSRS